MELTDARTKLYLIGVACFVQLVNGDPRISRADISAVLGENADPNFWPSRGRRNSLAETKQYLERKINTNTLNGRLEKALYVDEPMWMTIDRRADADDDDYFWVTRGRRRASSSWRHPTVKLASNNYRYRDESDSKIK